MYEFIEHQVSEMEDLVQRCLICGEVIADYNGVMIHPATSGKITGWAAGSVYISVLKNPTRFLKELGDDDVSESCKPS